LGAVCLRIFWKGPNSLIEWSAIFQIPQDGNVAVQSGVYYRLIMRQSMFGRGSGSNINPDMGGTMPESSIFGFRFQKCPSAADNYVRCDAAGDYFLDQMMRWLQGMRK
jgi:hypothetical protein